MAYTGQPAGIRKSWLILYALAAPAASSTVMLVANHQQIVANTKLLQELNAQGTEALANHIAGDALWQREIDARIAALERRNGDSKR